MSQNKGGGVEDISAVQNTPPGSWGRGCGELQRVRISFVCRRPATLTVPAQTATEPRSSILTHCTANVTLPTHPWHVSQTWEHALLSEAFSPLLAYPFISSDNIRLPVGENFHVIQVRSTSLSITGLGRKHKLNGNGLPIYPCRTWNPWKWIIFNFIYC